MTPDGSSVGRGEWWLCQGAFRACATSVRGEYTVDGVGVAGGSTRWCWRRGVCGLETDDECVGEWGKSECGDGDGGGGEVVGGLTKGTCGLGCLRPTLRGKAAKGGAPSGLWVVKDGPPAVRLGSRCREIAHLRRDGAAPKMGHPVLFLVRPVPLAREEWGTAKFAAGEGWATTRSVYAPAFPAAVVSISARHRYLTFTCCS